jgi:hypothetical protein
MAMISSMESCCSATRPGSSSRKSRIFVISSMFSGSFSTLARISSKTAHAESVFPVATVTR